MTQRKKPTSDINQLEDMETADMETNIERTRGEISEDLRALGDKLSPERLKSDAKEAVQEAKNAAKETLQEAKTVATDTFREVKDSAMETVQDKVDDLRTSVRHVERQTRDFFSENAVPLALMGIGAAWFMAKRRQRPGMYYDGGYRYEGERWSSSGGGGRTRPLGERVGERVRSMSEGAEDRYDNVKDRVRDFAERETEQARQLARDAGHRVSESSERARDFMGRELQSARDFSRRVSDDNPLAVGMAAIAAGIGVGLLLPQTEPERELLGSKRDELLGDAKQTLSEMGQTAKDTARDVKNTLSNSVQR
jgi:ElaB/YqjD/DUF883 family membrane-anchored ribosome-binding protein